DFSRSHREWTSVRTASGRACASSRRAVYGTRRPKGSTRQAQRGSAIVRAKERQMDARTRETAAIDHAIDTALAEKRIVGGVILAMQNGDLLSPRAAGLADRERNIPMREDAVFRLASLTKPLVTAAALRMAEAGQIALRHPVM